MNGLGVLNLSEQIKMIADEWESYEIADIQLKKWLQT